MIYLILTRAVNEFFGKKCRIVTLKGKTPNEVYFNRCAANAKPRIETRPHMKQRTSTAGAKVKIQLDFLEGRLHLPILKVERV